MSSVFHEHTQFVNVTEIDDLIQDILNTPIHYNVLSLFSGAGGMDYGFKGGFQLFNQEYYKH